MKKLIAIVLTVYLVFAFAACSLIPGSFSTSGFKIKLSSDFKETKLGGYDAAFYNGDLYIAAVKYSSLNIKNFDTMTATEYAEKTVEDNKVTGATVNDFEGIPAFRYDVESTNSTFLTLIFKGREHFWRVQFMADTDKFDDLADEIAKYAKTIRVS